MLVGQECVYIPVSTYTIASSTNMSLMLTQSNMHIPLGMCAYVCITNVCEAVTVTGHGEERQN